MNNAELMHWKYIKREKKNGKWVYSYNKKTSNKTYSEVEKEAKTAAENYEHNKNMALITRKQYEDNTEMYKKTLNEQYAKRAAVNKEYYEKTSMAAMDWLYKSNQASNMLKQNYSVIDKYAEKVINTGKKLLDRVFKRK